MYPSATLPLTVVVLLPPLSLRTTTSFDVVEKLDPEVSDTVKPNVPIDDSLPLGEIPSSPPKTAPSDPPRTAQSDPPSTPELSEKLSLSFPESSSSTTDNEAEVAVPSDAASPCATAVDVV